MRFFVVGDVHGYDEPFYRLLKHWNVDKDKLIQLGDMIDRGPNSLDVLRRMMHLNKAYGAEVIMGNHEEHLLTFLEFPDSEAQIYYPIGGDRTLHSFVGEKVAYSRTPQYIADYVTYHFQEEIAFLRTLPSYVEYGDWVFVHGGVNLNLRDWRQSSDADFRRHKNQFWHEKNDHGKTFVFGHIATSNLHQEPQNHNIWVSPCQTKIGIDGSIVEQDGKLHGLHINGTSYEVVSVTHGEVK